MLESSGTVYFEESEGAVSYLLPNHIDGASFETIHKAVEQLTIEVNCTNSLVVVRRMHRLYCWETVRFIFLLSEPRCVKKS